MSTLSVAILAGLEGAINAALALDPDTRQRLATLGGRVIAVELQGPELTLFMLPGPEGIRLMGRFEGEPDTTLRGRPLSLVRMAAGGTGEGLFSGDILIRGDVETGQRFQRILAGLDVDWEEHLSHITGDVIAHQVGNATRNLTAWASRAADTLGRDLAEYLQEESGTLPAQGEMEDFLAAVDSLRMDADRLEARVKRLREWAAAGPR